MSEGVSIMELSESDDATVFNYTHRLGFQFDQMYDLESSWNMYEVTSAHEYFTAMHALVNNTQTLALSNEMFAQHLPASFAADVAGYNKVIADLVRQDIYKDGEKTYSKIAFITNMRRLLAGDPIAQIW
jgi:hypothetical protein